MALMTSLPVVLLNLDLVGCSLKPEASHLVVSGLLSHGCWQSCDLKKLNISSLSLADANIETLCSGLKHYKRLKSLIRDHYQITSKGGKAERSVVELNIYRKQKWKSAGTFVCRYIGTQVHQCQSLIVVGGQEDKIFQLEKSSR